MELDHELIGSIVLAVVSSAYFKKFGDFIITEFKSWVKRKRKIDTDLKSVVDDISDVYYLLDSLIRGTSASRALIVKISNGGGNPRPDKPLYSSVIYEKAGDDINPIKQDWQKRELDLWHVNFVSELIENKEMILLTEELSNDTALKNVYMSQGIIGSRVFKLFRSKNNVIYLTLNYKKDFDPEIKGGPFEDFDITNLIDSKVSTLKNIFKRNSEIISQV